MKKTALITGITSQDGAYLAKYLLEKNYLVVGIIRSSKDQTFNGLNYLNIEDRIILEYGDLLDGIGLLKLFNKYLFDEVYNLAAQSSVALSFEQPFSTINFNSRSVLNFLELIRISNVEVKLLQPVSSEMYGGSCLLPINEESPIKPRSPYAISKALAYWAVINYREAYGLFASNAILFNHESVLRPSNFFVKKVITTGIQIVKGEAKFLKVGSIDIKRDFGYAPEYVKAMWLILQTEIPEDFIISSGASVSLRHIIIYVFEKLNININKLVIDPINFRPIEFDNIYGDNSKIKEKLNWEYDLDFFKVLDLLIDEELQINGVK